jgi:hypothetical protein
MSCVKPPKMDSAVQPQKKVSEIREASAPDRRAAQIFAFALTVPASAFNERPERGFPTVTGA